MVVFFAGIFFILGAVVGSFLNVVIYRVPANLEIFKKRSFCPSCKTPLSPIELIPIASYFLLRGKCRTCSQSISLQYPIVEIITGLLFLASFFVWLQKFGANPLFLPQLFYFFLIICILIVIFAIDAKSGIIPDSVLIVAIAGSLFLVFLTFAVQILVEFLNLKLDPSGFGRYLIEAGFLQNQLKSFGVDLLFRLTTAIGVALFFTILILLTAGRGMGWGDVKFGFFLGFVYAVPSIFEVLLLSFLTGAIVALLLIILKKKKFGQTLPFGPFLSIGALITLFFGQTIILWYLQALI